MRTKIYPDQCNYFQVDGKLMMHGPRLFELCDREVAMEVDKLLEGTDLIGLTVGANKLQWYYGPLMGETLEVKVELRELGDHRMTFYCQVIGDKGKCFDCFCSFCSFTKDCKLSPHNLTI